MAPKRVIALLAIFVTIAAACGDAGKGGGSAGAVTIEVAERQAPTAETRLAGEAITDFGLALFSEVRSAGPEANTTVSPASVAIALGMLEPGTIGAAQEQIRELLRIESAPAFHASMNALEQDLEARVPLEFGDDDDPGEVTIRIANAAYLQEGFPFNPAYLESVGSNYGPILHEVDFEPDPDAVAHQINDFVADATNDQIVDLIADDVIQPETVLALVNALYLKASWLETFDEAETTDAPFTLFDGSEVEIPLMHGTSSSSAAGDGWVGATKLYTGSLSAQFILPDDGRFEETAASLPAAFEEYDRNVTSRAPLSLPRFETRTSVELTEALQALGLVAPYSDGGLLGIADVGNLVIDKVIHESFVAMDEEGTEAAAATVILAFTTSAPRLPPVPVVLDRPFFYRVIDVNSGATLFIGQVTDPTA